MDGLTRLALRSRAGMCPRVRFVPDSSGVDVQAWVRKRAKRRRDGRLVLVTTVVFEAAVYDELRKRVLAERFRSAIVSEAVRHALGTPGWLDEALVRLAGEDEEVPSTRTPSTRRSGAPRRGPVAGVPSSRAPSSRRGAPSFPVEGGGASVGVPRLVTNPQKPCAARESRWRGK